MDEKSKKRKFIEAMAYIIYSVALWVVCYCQRFDFEKIKIIYIFSFTLVFVMAICLYDDSPFDLFLEFLKSTVILVAISIMTFCSDLYNVVNDYNNLIINNEAVMEFLKNKINSAIHWGVPLIGNQIFVFVIVLLVKSNKVLFGKYNQAIGIWTLVSIICVTVATKANLVAIIITGIATILYSYEYYLKNRKALELDKLTSENRIKLSQKIEEELNNCKNINDKLTNENTKLIEENLCLKGKLFAIQKKLVKDEKYGRKKRKK